MTDWQCTEIVRHLCGCLKFRMCPGRHGPISDDSLYSIIPSVLAVYNIKAPVDEFGKFKPLKAELSIQAAFCRMYLLLATSMGSTIELTRLLLDTLNLSTA